MTQFDTLDKMNTNFVSLSEQELMEMDGGAAPIIAWIIANPVTAGKIAGGITAGGIAIYNIVVGNW